MAINKLLNIDGAHDDAPKVSLASEMEIARNWQKFPSNIDGHNARSGAWDNQQ